MTRDQALAIIRQHTDYGGGIDVNGLADALTVAAIVSTPMQREALLVAIDAIGAWETGGPIALGALCVIQEMLKEGADWVHELKCDPEVFPALLDGSKTVEIRFNDRDYKVGDSLVLNETRYSYQEMNGPEPRPLEYTGRKVTRVVSHILEGYGLRPGFVALSFAKEES